jgi:hypothetical protein
MPSSLSACCCSALLTAAAFPLQKVLELLLALWHCSETC